MKPLQVLIIFLFFVFVTNPGLCQEVKTVYIEEQGVNYEPEPTEPYLISRGKPAAQSSIGWDGSPHLAVDGSYSQQYGDKTCMHTQLEVNPWWRVDLGHHYHLHSVKVWNRADCCGERLNSLTIAGSNDDQTWYVIGSFNGVARNGGIYAIPVQSHRKYRFVRLMLSKETADYLTLCEVEIFGTRRRRSSSLISRGKYASQSSVGWNGVPNLANDGLYSQNYDDKTCSHTNLEKNPWWKIDLGATYNVESVKVWNRADCCGERLSSLVVHISSDDENWQQVGTLGQPAVNGAVYSIPIQGTGRYVRLILGKDTPDYLQLCEVEVYGTPQ
jgi:hypothetical protein